MIRLMRLIPAFFLLLACTKFSVQQPKSAELTAKSGEVIFKLASFDASPAQGNLEVGAEISGAKLRVDPAPANGIEVQFVTEIGIADEGPHVELKNWRAQESLWIALPQGADKTYVLPPPEGFRRAPVATPQEIADEALKQFGPKWQKLALQCPSATAYPCSAVITKIRVRANSAPAFLEIHVPGGC